MTMKRKLKSTDLLIPAGMIIAAALLLLGLSSGWFGGLIQTRGNTAANLTQGGIAAEADGWIYAIDAHGGDQGLYRVKTDGSSCVRLYSGRCRSVNVSGGWVYFISYNTGDGQRLYKVPVSGGDPIQLYDSVEKIMLIGSWIYCQDSRPQGISKIRTDGTGLTHLAVGGYTLLDVQGSWIYCTQYSYGNNTAFCRMRTDGTDRSLIREGISQPVLDGGWLYFCKQSELGDEEYTPLYKIKADGSQTFLLSGSGCSDPFVTERWVYFNTPEGIFRMKTDGTGKVKISDDRYLALNAAGDWLIYRSSFGGVASEDYVLMKMRRDGSDSSVFWGDSVDE